MALKLDTPIMAEDIPRTFVLRAPDKREFPIKAASLAEVTLAAGYQVIGEVIRTADIAGSTHGYVVVPPLPDGLRHYTLMTHLLHEHGGELREWLHEGPSAA